MKTPVPPLTAVTSQLLFCPILRRSRTEVNDASNFVSKPLMKAKTASVSKLVMRECSSIAGEVVDLTSTEESVRGGRIWRFFASIEHM
jgi:hypothetical protein